MNLELDGTRVLITGASRGIGREVALRFAQAGSGVLHLAARSRDGLEQTAEAIHATSGAHVEIHPLDLSQTQNVLGLARRAGAIDILVNNAADSALGPLDRVSDEDWRRSMDLKVLAYAALARECYARMKEQGAGVIINNIGIAGETWDANYIAGVTGNAAMMAFSRALGARSLDDGIRVVGVNPGAVATERMERMMRRRALESFGDEERWPEFLARLPGGRAASPGEVADLMLFLASRRAAYISGTVVTIDGGMASRRAAS
jgi:NAD(P)-dependent dehydrogenase (short-subunit alcohol dehydrogenase family)